MAKVLAVHWTDFFLYLFYVRYLVVFGRIEVEAPYFHVIEVKLQLDDFILPHAVTTTNHWKKF
jgi:hypothetical protein